jgi:hypothetical protein
MKIHSLVACSKANFPKNGVCGNLPEPWLS